MLIGQGHNFCVSLEQWQEKRREAGESVVTSGLQLLDSLETFPAPLLKQDTSVPQ